MIGMDDVTILNTTLSRSHHFGFETRLDGHANSKMANDDRCLPLCDNDKGYDNVKDLSYFNFDEGNDKENVN